MWNNYNKACLTDTQKAYLHEHLAEAVDCAKALKEHQNPSSGVYKLIETLAGAVQ